MNTSKKLHEDPCHRNGERSALDAATEPKESHRDAQGRFVGGNPGGPGNPFARRVAELRKVLLSCITDEEMRVIAGQLVVKAKMGDLAAIKLLFQYYLGKPTASVNPDTLDQQEMQQYQEGMTPEQLEELMSGRRQQAGELIQIMRVLLPVFAQNFKDAMAGSLQGDPLQEDEADLDEPVQSRERQDAAPSANGENDAAARQPATRPSPNGGPKKTNAETPADHHDGNGRHKDKATDDEFYPRRAGDAH